MNILISKSFYVKKCFGEVFKSMLKVSFQVEFKK